MDRFDCWRDYVSKVETPSEFFIQENYKTRLDLFQMWKGFNAIGNIFPCPFPELLLISPSVLSSLQWNLLLF